MSNIKRKMIAISGGMDPTTIAHCRLIKDAATYGDVVVILNSDAWLLRKKGYKFMPWEERAEILMAIKGVTDVVQVDDSDGTVCEALRRIRPDYFANGGDRKVGNTPEGDVCAELGIEMLWGVGGTDKVQSSSWLIDAVRKS
jgi:hypothetical protein